MPKDADSSSKNRGKVKLHYEGTYDDNLGRMMDDVEGFSWVNKADYIRFYDETAYDPCKCDEQGCLSCFLDETNGWANGFGSSVGMLWFGKDEQGKKWNYDGDLDLVYQFNAETKEAYVARGDDGSDLPPKYAILKRPTYMVRVRIEDAPNLQPVNMPDATKQYHSRMNKEGMIYDEELGSFQPMENYDLSKAVMDAEVTKRASTGMIVQDGDPSSPPSDIFMADGYALKRVDYIIDTLEDLRYALDELVDGEDEFERNFDSVMEEDNFYNRTARTKQLLGEAMNQMSMLATEEFNAEDPTQADASDLGGPTTPGNAGVPADVGGDDLVPYDSPSAPPAGVFMNAEYKTYESRPVRNALFGVAFAVSGLYFWSTAGSVVKNWVVVRVEKYAPKLLEPQFQTMLTLTAFFGIIYFGMKLRGSSKGLTIPSMIDLPLESAVEA
jgi:hypothetical protein